MKWSIVIGAYNQGKYIADILEAIDKFGEESLEILYCDDGSDDETKAIIASFKKRQGRPNLIHLWQPKAGFRLTRNVNNGFKKARGERVVCFMGDSIPDKNLLREHDKVYEEDRILTGVRYNVKDAKNLELIERDWRLDLLEDIDLIDVPWRRFTGNNWCASKKLLEDVGWWNEDFEGYGLEDFEFALRCYKKGYRFTPVLNAIVYHISHPKWGENEQNQLKWFPLEKDFLEKAGLSAEQNDSQSRFSRLQPSKQ